MALTMQFIIGDSEMKSEHILAPLLMLQLQCFYLGRTGYVFSNLTCGQVKLMAIVIGLHGSVYCPNNTGRVTFMSNLSCCLSHRWCHEFHYEHDVKNEKETLFTNNFHWNVWKSLWSKMVTNFFLQWLSFSKFTLLVTYSKYCEWHTTRKLEIFFQSVLKSVCL